MCITPTQLTKWNSCTHHPAEELGYVVWIHHLPVGCSSFLPRNVHYPKFMPIISCFSTIVLSHIPAALKCIISVSPIFTLYTICYPVLSFLLFLHGILIDSYLSYVMITLTLGNWNTYIRLPNHFISFLAPPPPKPLPSPESGSSFSIVFYSAL